MSWSNGVFDLKFEEIPEADKALAESPGKSSNSSEDAEDSIKRTSQLVEENDRKEEESKSEAEAWLDSNLPTTDTEPGGAMGANPWRPDEPDTEPGGAMGEKPSATGDLGANDMETQDDNANLLTEGLDEAEYLDLNNRYAEILKKAKLLMERYIVALWRYPLWEDRNAWPTCVFNEGRLQVYDKEKGTHYALYGYGWLRSSWSAWGIEYGWGDWSSNSTPEKWRLPKLLVFGDNNEEYELNEAQYKEVLDKIENVLWREEEKVKELESKKMAVVNAVIWNL